ncbi:MAG TPA: GNAT family N-acetyltransferase [Acidimicrobiales bacterium]|nr:GNAT family N-acetyltransferase [Acidimicrobiales bacterium]
MPSSGSSGREGDARLTAHLETYLGRWPPRAAVDVVGHEARLGPAWDGASVVAVAVASPAGTLVSVVPGRQSGPAASRLAATPVLTDDFRRELAALAGVGEAQASPWLPFRWTVEPADLPDAGQWVGPEHPALPDWLRLFAGPVLVALDPVTGRYLAGVAAKPHTRWGRELAVGTDEAARGRGLARRLVAQKARAVLADGAVPLYVHHPDNVASARVADAAGLADTGWRILYVWG